MLTLPLKELRAVGSQFAFGADEAIERLARDAQFFAQVADFGVTFDHFLARYLHSLALRREIHEGLNTIERWNGANDFVYFAGRGEMTSNRRQNQEISMLSLHLLQNCMVYVNTLMLQEVLAQPHWQGRLTETDLRALTPLTWEHVSPYGRFELDMSTRLPLK